MAMAEPFRCRHLPCRAIYVRQCRTSTPSTAPSLPSGWTSTVTKGASTTTAFATRGVGYVDSGVNTAWIDDTNDYRRCKSVFAGVGRGQYRRHADCIVPSQLLCCGHRMPARAMPELTTAACLEISINGGDFADVTALGGSITSGGLQHVSGFEFRQSDRAAARKPGPKRMERRLKRLQDRLRASADNRVQRYRAVPLAARYRRRRSRLRHARRVVDRLIPVRRTRRRDLPRRFRRDLSVISHGRKNFEAAFGRPLFLNECRQ